MKKSRIFMIKTLKNHEKKSLIFMLKTCEKLIKFLKTSKNQTNLQKFLFPHMIAASLRKAVQWQNLHFLPRKEVFLVKNP